MANQGGDHWAELWEQVDGLGSALSRSKAVNVNSEQLREATRAAVQHYFRQVRPELAALGVAGDALAGLDSPAQELLRLANGRNRRSSYRAALRSLRRIRTGVELEREQKLGVSRSLPGPSGAHSGVESLILETLRELVPSAALSYEQAILDLQAPSRLSYRGAAVEIRECVREVLDHLAPDRDVTKADGFKLEKGATKPTMKQKARFILKARGIGRTAMASPQDSIERIEEGAASLARSIYARGSVSTHTATTRGEVLTIKLYAESVLAELLQVHAVS